jgi:hypothetical protein
MFGNIELVCYCAIKTNVKAGSISDDLAIGCVPFTVHVDRECKSFDSE